MYMARIELDMSQRSTMLAIASPNKLHGAIESGFQGERKRRLWRIDQLNGRTYLLLISEEIPKMTEAITQFSPKGAQWEVKNYDSFLSAIQEGSRWHFRLAANPTFSRVREGERGTVHAHVTVEQQKQWLIEKGPKHGFEVKDPAFEVTERRILSFLKGEQRNRVTLGVCVFEGMLTVLSPELFCKALTEGIGRGKAYGYGLLTVVKA